MDPSLKIILEKLDEFSKRLDNHDARLDQRFSDLDHDLSARDSTVDRHLADLESSRSTTIDPGIFDSLAALELAYNNQAIDITMRLAMLESAHIMPIADDRDAWMTKLEEVAADIGSWRLELEGIVDDLKLQVKNAMKSLDHVAFDTMSHSPGIVATSLISVNASSSSMVTTERPIGHGVATSPRDVGFGSS
jgi:hypothetical protein